MAEVINLSDDDDDVVCEANSTNPLASAGPPKPARCLNTECRSRENLRRATQSVRRFYGVLTYPKKTRVCLLCLARVNVHQRQLTEQLRAGTSLMQLNSAPLRDTVLLTDSESDPDDAAASTESEMELSLSGSDAETHSCTGKTKKLRSTLEKMFWDLELKKHFTDSIEDLTARLFNAEKGFEDLDKQYNVIEKDLNSIRIEFYDAFKPPFKMLPELDTDNPAHDERVLQGELDVVQAALVRCQASLPPIAPLARPPLLAGQTVYAMKYSLFARWVPGQVVSIAKKEINNTTYIVRYNRNMNVNPPRELTGRQLAYEYPCATRLIVGTRVIARYKDDNNSSAPKTEAMGLGSFYVGIVAEVPTVANKYKYLIFFDDGYAQYVAHRDIRVVTEASQLPWEDVCSDSRDFIKEYVQMYPERPMVRLQKWNNVKTEWNGKWWRAQVMEVEGSLVKMYFPTDGRMEWIYRGSTRLSPLFHKKMSLQANAEQTTRLTARRRTMVLPGRQVGPVVEYGTFGQENSTGGATPVAGLPASRDPLAMPPPILVPSYVEPAAASSLSAFAHTMPSITYSAAIAAAAAAAATTGVLATTSAPNRSVAKKSTAARPGTPPPDLIERIQQEKTGYIRKAQIPPLPRRFRPHQCSPACVGGVKGEELLKRNRNISPLLIPIVLGWRRQIVKQRKKTVTRKSIYYVTPCCRRLRNIDELFMYLRTTYSKLEIDFFSYELSIDVINEWAPHKELFSIPDLTNGVEPMPISVVNSLDTDPPLPLEYCNKRKPAPEVPLNLDPDFLVCCSCTDDCQDKTRCECWLLTLECNSRMPSGLRLNEPGYSHRRLYEQVPSGIFECNSRCSCRHTCQNRVVQNPLRLKLQLFKTARRGWGVRTLHDVPRGSFLCVYVGRMITDTVANQEGKICGGDDYYAELDYIEVVEEMKEGYEDDVDDKDDGDDARGKSKGHSGDDQSDSEQLEQRRDKLDDMYDTPYTQQLKGKTLGERQPSSRIQARAGSKRKYSLTGSSDEDDPDDPSPVVASTGVPHVPTPPSRHSDEEDDDEGADEKQRQRQHFSASIEGPPLKGLGSPQKKSLRDCFGYDEQVYIMDAKRAGNIGRFLNHSCQPNVFVQNVFVDSQDLRFPYMSFFAVTSIRAGQELTWDYAYEVGTVAGKVKYCYCGARRCRGRLL